MPGGPSAFSRRFRRQRPGLGYVLSTADGVELQKLRHKQKSNGSGFAFLLTDFSPPN
jgi:hypothetical protein